MLYIIHVMPKLSEIDLCNFPIQCTTVALGTSKCFQLKVFLPSKRKGPSQHTVDNESLDWAGNMCPLSVWNQIYQSICRQTEWIIKISAQKVRREYKWHSKYKIRHGWKNSKKIETDCNCGFWKLVSLTVFQSSFLLFVTTDIMLANIFCLAKAVILFHSPVLRNFHSEKGRVTGIIRNWIIR